MDPRDLGQRAPWPADTLAALQTNSLSIFVRHLSGVRGAGGSGFAVNADGEALLDSEFILHENVFQKQKG